MKYRLNLCANNDEYSEIVDIPDSELLGMSEEEIEDYVHIQYLQDWLHNYIDCWIEKVEETDGP